MNSTPTPPRGVAVSVDDQARYDADQDARIRSARRRSTIALVGMVLALTLGAVAVTLALLGPALAPHASVPVVHVAAPPACPPAPQCPACAACPACPAPPSRGHRAR